MPDHHQNQSSPAASAGQFVCRPGGQRQRAPNTTTTRQWVVPAHLSMEEIRPGIWVHTAWRKLDSGGIFPANGLLVRNGQELILTDTAWGKDITQELLAWIDAEIALPVSQASITHFHADSMAGAAVLAAHHIPFAAHPLTRILGKQAGVLLPQPINELRNKQAVTVANVEVFYPGPGHSRDNLVVWIPHAKLLFGTCAVRSTTFPGIGNSTDADLKNWPKAIAQIEQRYPEIEIAIPEHGPLGGPELLAHTIALFNQQ